MTIRKLLLGLSLVVGLEAVAIACSCIAPGSPEESRALIRDAARELAAVVEVEVLSDYRPGGPGELVRVQKTLFGNAPKTFRIERGDFASSATCDLLLTKGERKTLLLRPGAKNGSFAMQSLCSDFLVSESYLPLVIEEARRR